MLSYYSQTWEEMISKKMILMCLLEQEQDMSVMLKLWELKKQSLIQIVSEIKFGIAFIYDVIYFKTINLISFLSGAYCGYKRTHFVLFLLSGGHLM